MIKPVELTLSSRETVVLDTILKYVKAIDAQRPPGSVCDGCQAALDQLSARVNAAVNGHLTAPPTPEDIPTCSRGPQAFRPFASQFPDIYN